MKEEDDPVQIAIDDAEIDLLESTKDTPTDDPLILKMRGWRRENNDG